MATKLQRRWRQQKRRRRHQENVELNVTAMLDMAFQLLSFFILTFEPSPIESLISLRMPPEQVTSPVGQTDKAPDDIETSLPLPMSILAKEDGEIDRIVIGFKEFSITSVSQIATTIGGELTNLLKEGDFDSLKLQIAENLRYGPMMQVVDICTRQKLPSGEPLTKINFVPLR